jgi:Holliday junction resolvasome RuvABC endonuclease subunit
MRIAGLDIGLNRTGWCIWNTENHVRVSDVVQSNGARGYKRIWDMMRDVTETLRQADVVVIEDLALGHFHVGSHVDLIGLTAIIRMALLRAEKRVYVVSPMTLKKFATGNGRADKGTMRLSVFKRWGVDTQDTTDDVADAVALCELGRALHEPDYRMAEFQKECLKKVRVLEWG